MSLMYFQPRALILVLILYFPSFACLSELFLSIVPHLLSPRPLPSLDHSNSCFCPSAPPLPGKIALVRFQEPIPLSPSEGILRLHNIPLIQSLYTDHFYEEHCV